MKQYHKLLKKINKKGCYKAPARENMPGTTSLFGHQFRHDLSTGFPLLTTKKMFWKGVVIELLWFLKGETNIKYLVDNGVKIWNQDAYNYYLKRCKEDYIKNILTPDDFDNAIKTCSDYDDLRVNSVNNSKQDVNGNLPCIPKNYILGDCGYQYGQVWRSWGPHYPEYPNGDHKGEKVLIDQIATVLNTLKTMPDSRRHIVTAWDPAHDKDLALTWCHAMFQFNCRPLSVEQRCALKSKEEWASDGGLQESWAMMEDKQKVLDIHNFPKYYLDCQLYQRSADVILGVPFNIASYALIIHVFAKICNMVPGDFIHTFGDVHIYDNHKEAVVEQLSRDFTKYKLPTLNIDDRGFNNSLEGFLNAVELQGWKQVIKLENYESYPKIEAELSTGLKK